MADDLSARDLSCYRSTAFPTPHLDRLAADGIRFRTAWATPLCSPSRALILTGRYAFRTGWYGLRNETFTCRDLPTLLELSGNHLSFANVLKCAGYSTAVAGKWQLSGTNSPDNQFELLGFDEHCIWGLKPCYFPIHSGYDPQRDSFRIEDIGPSNAARYWHPAIIRNGRLVHTSPDDFGPDLYSDFVIDFIARHKDQPFCVFYPMVLPHFPITATPDPHTPSNRKPASIRSFIEYTDHVVGKIVRGVDDLGLGGKTVILFTSDNGTDGYGKGNLSQEKGVRVPMLLRCADLIKSSTVSDELVELGDIFPTLIDMAGAQSMLTDYPIDGRSFASILQDKRGPRREWIFSYIGKAQFLRDQRWLRD
jgi:arylsulfatase A